MTRQAQIVRSNSRSGPAQSRDADASGGGAVIHCLYVTCAQTWTGGGSAGGIQVDAREPYQRFYFSATIGQVHLTAANGDSVAGYVALNYEGTDLSVITVKDQAACLTGVVDLPAGLHVVETLVLPWDFGANVAIDGIAMQCIEGQAIETPGCLSTGGCHS